VHLTTTVTIASVMGIYQGLVRPSLPGGFTCLEPGQSRCDPSGLNALDKTVVGNNSDGWLLASDITSGTALLGVIAGSIVDVTGSSSDSPGHDLLVDGVVIAESAAVAGAISFLIKFAVQRPRPTQYTEGRYVGTVEHRLSFPSGHTTSTAAVTTAYATTFALRHPDSGWRWLVYGGAAVATLVTGYARVAGGFHFYTDVLAGIALGTGVGIALPLAMRREPQSAVAILPAFGPDGTRGLALTATF